VQRTRSGQRALNSFQLSCYVLWFYYVCVMYTVLSKKSNDIFSSEMILYISEARELLLIITIIVNSSLILIVYYVQLDFVITITRFLLKCLSIYMTIAQLSITIKDMVVNLSSHIIHVLLCSITITEFIYFYITFVEVNLKEY